MAISREIYCGQCKKSKTVMCSVGEWPSLCGECEQKNEADKKAAHLESLAKLPIEERLRRLEEAMYEASKQMCGLASVISPFRRIG